MPTVDITDAPIDLHRRTARVLSLDQLDFMPTPGQPVTLLDRTGRGPHICPGYVYGVRYRHGVVDTAVFEPDFQITLARPGERQH